MAKRKTKTTGRTRKSDIVPFEKQMPITSPETIPEDASLDVYEQMAAKMALSKDEIIDKALDNLEGKTESKPVETESVKTETVSAQQTPTTTKVKSKKTTKQDDQLNTEICNLKKELLTIQKELADCKKDNEVLKTQISQYQSGELKGAFQTEIDELINKNDDLILKNSELEFEISRLGAENTRLKQILEQKVNDRMLPPQTNTQEAYTRIGGNNNSSPSKPTTKREQMIQQQIMINRALTPLRRGLNGYESWN